MNISTIFGLLLACGLGVFIGTHIAQHNNGYEVDKHNVFELFNKNIFEETVQNSFFRKVLVTGSHSQVVVMSIPVGEEIGMERHKVDQTLLFVEGHGQAIINGKTSDVYPQSLVFVPAGAEHNFKNVGPHALKLFTIYAPAQHKPGTVEKTKSEY